MSEYQPEQPDVQDEQPGEAAPDEEAAEEVTMSGGLTLEPPGGGVS